MKSVKNIKGFSLVEVIIVVAIIGIIAAVAVPMYRNHIDTSAVNRCYNLLMAARMTADNIIQLDNGSAASIEKPGDIGLSAGRDCDSVDVTGAGDNGDITLSATIPTAEGDNTITWSRDGADATWTCDSSIAISAPDSCPPTN